MSGCNTDNQDLIRAPRGNEVVRLRKDCLRSLCVRFPEPVVNLDVARYAWEQLLVQVVQEEVGICQDRLAVQNGHGSEKCHARRNPDSQLKRICTLMRDHDGVLGRPISDKD